MTDELIGTVLDRATADITSPEPAKLLVLAALEGPDHLKGALAGASSPFDGRESLEPDDPTTPSDAARAYLSRVTVTGFRGIGPAATLTLEPKPGLTVIAGRNGCGKSSFAEALEVALTRHSYRWSKRTAVWSESWRNLHQPEPTSIVVELAEESRGRTKVGPTGHRGPR